MRVNTGAWMRVNNGASLAMADIVTAQKVPDGVTRDAPLWAARVGGAIQRDGYREPIEPPPA
jgi:hypothetical protein